LRAPRTVPLVLIKKAYEVTELSSSTLKPAATQQQKRRQRTFLRVAVRISGIKPSGTEFHEFTHTVVVNANGGMVALQELVQSKQNLKIKNVETQEEVFCSVVHINKESQGSPQIAVEFAEPAANFWRVSFPPLDWSPTGPESKRFTPFKVPDKLPTKK
jgi:ribosomal protein S1